MQRNNDVLKSLRYTLDLGDIGMSALFELGGLAVPAELVAGLLLPDDHPDYVDCSDSRVAAFLDGLVVRKRGPSDNKPDNRGRLSNNAVLKKLRIAFKLRDDDVADILKRSGFPLSKSEINALFRQPGQDNYRECGDQVLRHFLRGLALRERP